MEILFVLAGLALILLAGKILHLSMSVTFKLLANGLAGGFSLLVLNVIGGIFNISIKINAINALIAGFFGLPGVLLMLLIKYFL